MQVTITLHNNFRVVVALLNLILHICVLFLFPVQVKVYAVIKTLAIFPTPQRVVIKANALWRLTASILLTMPLNKDLHECKLTERLSNA